MIIGIGHRKHAGKSEAAKVFEKAGYKRLSLADPLYKIGGIMAGWDTTPETDEQKSAFKAGYWWRKDRWERGSLISPDWNGRQLLEYVGTDILRAAFPDIWIALLDWQIRGMIRNATEAPPTTPIPQHFVIDDIRFPNEAQWIRDQGGVLIHIDRPSLGPVDRKAHESEWALAEYPGWHYTVKNEGTLADFHADIGSILVDIEEGGV